MVTNIPTAQDFFDSGKELLDFSWDVVANLLKNLDEADYFGINPKDVSQNYWAAAKRRLTTALSITQQGVEFVLKGKIAQISPFLLLADAPGKWPSPYDGSANDFASFRTIDAQDLVRVHDTFASQKLSADFTARFHDLRDKRNRIMHSIDKNIVVHVKDVIDSVLFMHKSLFPTEAWTSLRLSLLETAPEIELGSIDYITNVISWELDLVLKLLAPAQVEAYFGIDKKQRRYVCPECYSNANTDSGFEHKLAVLQPKGASTTTLYCIVCNKTCAVSRKDCTSDDCPGNVISDDGLCLTCCRYQEDD